MMNEIKPRRQYSREYKLEAVGMVLRGDKTATQIARELGINVNLLYRWKSQYLADEASSFPGSGHLQDPEEERIRALERELRSVQEERDILKKVVSIFSKAPR